MQAIDLDLHPVDCPFEWDYSKHPKAGVVAERCADVIFDLRNGGFGIPEIVCDSRPLHGRMFEGLTPPDHSYFAGHYRGEDFKCLRRYEVMVQGDPSVGTRSKLIGGEMGTLRDIITQAEAALRLNHDNPLIDEDSKLFYTVAVVSRLLEAFLRIHPYANGNGHMARFMVWAMLGHFEYWPSNWPLDGRPSYVSAIKAYRSGNPQPLEQFILGCI